MYSNLRARYFGNKYLTNILQILQCKDKVTAFNLANFLLKAFTLREKVLELRAYFQ